MSMLSRYKKEGGFSQLVELIETCEPKKQQNFLKVIETEDLNWARAIKLKMLTMKKIFAFGSEILEKVSGKQAESVLIALYSEYPKQLDESILPLYSEDMRAVIVTAAAREPADEKEVIRAEGRFIAEVRKNMNTGSYNWDKVAPELVIPEDVESQLLNGTFVFPIEKPKRELGSRGTGSPRPSRPGQSALERGIESAKKPSTPDQSAALQEAEKKLEAAEKKIEELKGKLSDFAYQNHRLRREHEMLKEKAEKQEKLKKSS